MKRPTQLTRGFRCLGAVGVAIAVAASLTGCDAVDSFTGSQSMRWVGDELLSKDSVSVADYKAVPLLPSLTAPVATEAFGQTSPSTSSDALVNGEGWSVSVEQSEYLTSVRYTDMCGVLLSDDEASISSAKEMLANLGGDPETWSWFVIKDAAGGARVVAEPNIEGRQTWATGTMSVLVDEDGVCSANARLMGFEKVEGQTELPSQYEVFQDARHTEGLSIAGDYDEVFQTWTLRSEGVLVPLWRFTAKDHGIVAVDLGDGLETALDTQSSLAASDTAEDVE